MVDALSRTGKHTITAVNRLESTSKMPAGVNHVKKVDFSSDAALVEAFTGQDSIIITLPVGAAPDLQPRIIDAAIKAGVPWVIPNEWGVDISHEGLSTDVGLGPRMFPIREQIEKNGAGKTRWIGLACGFWYEFSLAGTESRYGFDFDKKTVTFFDEGETKINTSTWPMLGRAIAALLSLKVSKDGPDDTETTLDQWANRSAHVSSFFVSQKDMFASVLKVTGDEEEDWKVSYEGCADRFQRGQEIFKGGEMHGLGMMLYSRVFYKDGAGDFKTKLDNKVLGLSEEDFDEATREGVAMAARGETNAIH